MSIDRIQLTEEQKANVLRIAKVVDAGDMALIEEIFNIERQVGLVVKALNDGLQYAVKLAETTQKLPGPKGEKGDNYVLTGDNLNEIAILAAKKIDVPIVEKVIEKKTEIIIKEPVMMPAPTIEKTIEIIKQEVLPEETLREIAELKDKIALLEGRVTKRGFFTGSGSRTIKVLNNGTEVSQNVLELNFTNPSAISTTGTVGRRVNVTTGGGTSILTASSGVVDGSNQTFVYATAPVKITVDQGRVMQKVSSDGTVNWTGTTTIILTIAPNFDLIAEG